MDSRLANLNEQIASYRSEIKKIEESYDALAAFQTSVSHSHSDFDDCIRSKKEKFQRLSNEGKNCHMVQSYYVTYNGHLGGLAVKSASNSYAILDGLISAKLLLYKTTIAGNLNLIDTCLKSVQTIEAEIRAAEEAAKKTAEEAIKKTTAGAKVLRKIWER